jgi:uncharacterized protein
MKKRTLYFKILPQLNHKNALVITGMRQVGKTSLMKQLAEAWEGKNIWFDFDNPLDTLIFENIDYNAIYEELRMASASKQNERFLVCIDEIQNFPEITKIIKYLIDHYGVKFIVTGSSNYYLRNLFPESLSGRKFLYTLYPLSFREYLYFINEIKDSDLEISFEQALKPQSKHAGNKFKKYYESYKQFGGFPEVVLTDDISTKKLVLKNIFASFFEKDIKVFNELKDIKELRDLILLLGPRNGNLIDVTRLASELGVNRVKIYNYLEFLEGTFFLRLIPKFTKSIDKAVAGGKKVYFSDTGMLNLITSTSPGQLLETTVANQLFHYGKLSFYNKRNIAEIDFILQDEIAFEVKNNALKNDISKLEKQASKINISKCYVISNSITDTKQVVYPWFL